MICPESSFPKHIKLLLRLYLPVFTMLWLYNSISRVLFISNIRYCNLRTIFMQIFIFCLFVCFCFFRATPTAYGSSQARVESELQLLAYAIVTAMPDLSRVCNLHWSSQQCQILNPLSKVRIEPASSWILVMFITTEPQGELLCSYFLSLTIHFTFHLKKSRSGNFPFWLL